MVMSDPKARWLDSSHAGRSSAKTVCGIARLIIDCRFITRFISLVTLVPRNASGNVNNFHTPISICGVVRARTNPVTSRKYLIVSRVPHPGLHACRRIQTCDTARYGAIRSHMIILFSSSLAPRLLPKPSLSEKTTFVLSSTISGVAHRLFKAFKS